MKRMIKSKNGFTLIEIVVVISIIVIIAGATFVGVDQVLDRANRNAEDLEENHGANFEAEAWATVKNLSVDIDSFKETSETSLTEDSEETSETETTETEPTASPNDKDEEFLKRKEELLEMGYTEDEIHIIYGDDGHIKSMSWRSTRRGIGGSGSATPGYMMDIDTSKPSWEMNTELSFDEPVQSCIISCPDGDIKPTLAGEHWQYELVSLGDGRYELKYKGDGNGRTPQTDFKLNLPGGSKIESYTTKN